MLTPDLLLQTKDDGHGLVQDEQLGLGLVALQVELHHAAQLLKGLVDVAYAQPLAGVVGHPPLPFALDLLLWGQVLVVVVTVGMGGIRGQYGTHRADRQQDRNEPVVQSQELIFSQL